MAANVELRSYHGIAPFGTALAEGRLRFNTADNDVISVRNPVRRPGRSYIKQVRLYALTPPTNGIDTMAFYMSGGGFGTGVQLNFKAEFSYTDPVGLGTDDMGGGVDAFSYTAQAPYEAISGTLLSPATGAFGPYFKFQLVLDATAELGTLSGQTGLWSYDEF